MIGFLLIGWLSLSLPSLVVVLFVRVWFLVFFIQWIGFHYLYLIVGFHYFISIGQLSLSLPSLRIGFRHAPLGLDRMRLGTASQSDKKHSLVATKPPLSKGGLEGLSISFYLVGRGIFLVSSFSLSLAEGNEQEDESPRTSS